MKINNSNLEVHKLNFISFKNGFELQIKSTNVTICKWQEKETNVNVIRE